MGNGLSGEKKIWLWQVSADGSAGPIRRENAEEKSVKLTAIRTEETRGLTCRGMKERDGTRRKEDRKRKRWIVGYRDGSGIYERKDFSHTKAIILHTTVFLTCVQENGTCKKTALVCEMTFLDISVYQGSYFAQCHFLSFFAAAPVDIHVKEVSKGDAE